MGNEATTATGADRANEPLSTGSPDSPDSPGADPAGTDRPATSQAVTELAMILQQAVTQQRLTTPPTGPSVYGLERQAVATLPEDPMGATRYSIRDIVRWTNDQAAWLNQQYAQLTLDQCIQHGYHAVFLPRNGAIPNRIRSMLDSNGKTWSMYVQVLIKEYVPSTFPSAQGIVENEYNNLRVVNNNVMAYLQQFDELSGVLTLIRGCPDSDDSKIIKVLGALPHEVHSRAVMQQQLMQSLGQTLTYEGLRNTLQTIQAGQLPVHEGFVGFLDTSDDQPVNTALVVSGVKPRTGTPTFQRRAKTTYPTRLAAGQKICLMLAFNGQCPKGKGCHWSHDPELIDQYTVQVRTELSKLEAGKVQATKSHQYLRPN